MAHLYELSDHYQVLMQVIGNEDTTEEQLKVQLADIKEQFNDKAESVAKIILSMSGDIDIIKAEEARLASRRNKLERKAEWLKSYLQQELTATGIKKVEGKLLTISLRDNPPSVTVVNENDIPAQFRRVIPESWQPDRKSILDWFKTTGEIVNGVSIVTDKKTLVIK